MLPGFMGNMMMAGGDTRALVLIPRTSGTTIGSMTAGGGIGAAFDGNTAQASSQSARRDTTAGWVGKTLAVPKTIGQVVTYGSSNIGYTSGSSTITLSIRGQVGGSVPNISGGLSAGVEIGTTGVITNINASNPQTIECTDKETFFDFVWVVATSGSGGVGVYIAEVELYAWE